MGDWEWTDGFAKVRIEVEDLQYDCILGYNVMLRDAGEVDERELGDSAYGYFGEDKHLVRFTFIDQLKWSDVEDLLPSDYRHLVRCAIGHERAV